jgi:hypothetical protein
MPSETDIEPPEKLDTEPLKEFPIPPNEFVIVTPPPTPAPHSNVTVLFFTVCDEAPST